MGSIIGHRIECNGVGALRGHTYPAKINTSNPPGCQYRSKTIMKMCLVAFVFFALTGLLFSPHKRLRVLFWDILHQCKVGCLKTVRKENNLAKSLRVVSFVACVASVSNRVIARKLERFLRSPPPSPSFMFFCSCPSFLDEPREETLATQAISFEMTGCSLGCQGIVWSEKYFDSQECQILSRFVKMLLSHFAQY